MNPFATGTVIEQRSKNQELVKLAMTQGLMPDEVKKLTRLSILEIPEEELLKAYCAHRDSDDMAIISESEGQYKCKICDTVIDHNVDIDELKKAVDIVTNALEKCKMQLIRLPQEDIREYFEIIPKIKRLPELYTISCKEFAKEFVYKYDKYVGKEVVVQTTGPDDKSKKIVSDDTSKQIASSDNPKEVETSSEEIINDDSEIMDKLKETVLIDEKKLEDAVSVIITAFRRNKGRILNRTKCLNLKKSIKKELLVLARYANKKNIICSFNNDGKIISISHMKFLRETYNIPFTLEPSKSSNKYTIKEVSIAKK